MAYTFENGTWGGFDDGIGNWNGFHKTRKNLGFTNSKELKSLLGNVTVYSRSDTSVKWPYSYLCLIQVVELYSWVWVNDMPNLYRLLQFIQAHEAARTMDVSISNFEELTDSPDVSNYLPTTYFAEAMRELHKYFKKKNGE